MSCPASDPYESPSSGKALGAVDGKEVCPDGPVPVAAADNQKQSCRKKRGCHDAKVMRRPKKVVYYFSSSSSSSEDDEAADDDKGNEHCNGGAKKCGERRGRKEVADYSASSSEYDPHSFRKNRKGKAGADNNDDCDDDGNCDIVVVIQNRNNGKGGGKEKVSATNPRIGSPTPIGFFAFGMTTLLYNVHNAQVHPKNQATMGLVIFYGGLTQFVCGWFELINMNTFGCTISTTYGAFWMATAVLCLWPANEYVISFGSAAYTGGFFFLWFIFAGTLFASSFKSPIMCIILFFSVMLNFFLQSVGFWCNSNKVAQVAGYEGIVVGSLATYIGMAFTLADVYGRNVLPLFPHKNFRSIGW